MGIGQGDPSDIGLADVADDVFGFDGIALDQLGNGRAVTGRRIMEAAHPTPLVEGHSPAVAMRTGTPTALHQPGKAETDIRGYIGAHAHQFTHSVTPPTKPRDFYWLDWSTFKGMVLQNLIRDRQGLHWTRSSPLPQRQPGSPSTGIRNEIATHPSLRRAGCHTGIRWQRQRAERNKHPGTADSQGICRHRGASDRVATGYSSAP